jgi:hypothetical protein
MGVASASKSEKNGRAAGGGEIAQGGGDAGEGGVVRGGIGGAAER